MAAKLNFFIKTVMFTKIKQISSIDMFDMGLCINSSAASLKEKLHPLCNTLNGYGWDRK